MIHSVYGRAVETTCDEKEGRVDTKLDALPAVMTENQVADFLQVSRTTVGRLGRTGQIQRLVIGRSVRYRARDVLAYVDQGASERRAA